MINPLESTPSGSLRARLGLPDVPLPLELRDALVDLSDARMVATMGRHLTQEERALAERQTQYVAAGFNSPVLGIQELLDAGISVPLQGRAGMAGIAVRTADGWEGDPAVARAAESAAISRARWVADHAPDAGPLRGVPDAG